MFCPQEEGTDMTKRNQKKSIFLSLLVSASFLLFMTSFLHSDTDWPEPAVESTSGMRQDGEQSACFCISSCGKRVEDDYYCCVFKDKECAAECVATHMRIKSVRARHLKSHPCGALTLRGVEGL